VNRAALDRATAALDPPFAVVDLDAFDANAADLLRRAGDTAVRLASKSVRCRALQRRALDAGLRGQLCFTLPEALWLADQGFDDLVVAYPTADRAALHTLAHGPHRGAITVMVDSRAHLELVEAAGGGPVRVCLDVDASWWPMGGRIRIGVKRSRASGTRRRGAAPTAPRSGPCSAPARASWPGAGRRWSPLCARCATWSSSTAAGRDRSSERRPRRR
jgi:D-serine deaminase-like pyridoxal phosphate-dependent protein